jgi:formamidopyrimidine-DNA glycosylase
LARLEVLDARWTRPLAPEQLAEALEGRRIESLRRRGKYLLWSFQGDVHLAQHLRMTGSLLWDPADEQAHTRAVMHLRPRARVIVTDPRRFGTAELLPGAEALEAFFSARVGLEPLEEAFTPEHLRDMARGRTAPIKAFLLDQRRVGGVGNIYADEALYRAGIHPMRPAGALTPRQHAALREGLIEALLAGIDARGASIDDFRHIDGVRGAFQDRFLVHRRAGEPCERCGGEIVKLVVGGRGTYVCEGCQPRPRRRPGGRAGRTGVSAASATRAKTLAAGVLRRGRRSGRE